MLRLGATWHFRLNPKSYGSQAYGHYGNVMDDESCARPVLLQRLRVVTYRYMNCSTDGYFAGGRHSRVVLRILPHGTHLRVVRILMHDTHWRVVRILPHGTH